MHGTVPARCGRAEMPTAILQSFCASIRNALLLSLQAGAWPPRASLDAPTHPRYSPKFPELSKSAQEKHKASKMARDYLANHTIAPRAPPEMPNEAAKILPWHHRRSQEARRECPIPLTPSECSACAMDAPSPVGASEWLQKMLPKRRDKAE